MPALHATFGSSGFGLAGSSPKSTAVLRPEGRYVFGNGVAASPGISKRFVFFAQRLSPSSNAAGGHVVLIQTESKYRYGNFMIAGPVRCLYIAGNRAVLGITIRIGTGTAATRVGESFYVQVADGRLAAADGLDNSGYTRRRTHNCYRGTHTGQMVVSGNIVVQ